MIPEANNIFSDQAVSTPVTADIALQLSEILKGIYSIFKNATENLEVQLKSDGTEITSIDRLVSVQLAEGLRNLIPGALIVSEESILCFRGKEELIFANQFLWIVDEVDGTQNLARQIPLYCVSVGLFKKSGEQFIPILGAILEPASGNLYIGLDHTVKKETLITGQSQYITPVSVDSHLSPLFFVSDDSLRSGKLPSGANYRCTGSVALDILYVGLGLGDATFLLYNIWDIAGALAVVNALQVLIFDLNSGIRLDGLSPKDFGEISKSGNWSLKKPLLICRADNFELALKFLGGMKTASPADCY